MFIKNPLAGCAKLIGKPIEKLTEVKK